MCIPVTPSLIIEPLIVEEPGRNDSINLETLMNEVGKTNGRIEGLSNGTR